MGGRELTWESADAPISTCHLATFSLESSHLLNLHFLFCKMQHMIAPRCRRNRECKSILQTTKYHRAGGNYTWVPQEMKHKLLHDPAIPLLGMKWKVQKHWKQGLEEGPVHPCSQSVNHKAQKLEAAPSVPQEWINKVWSSHTVKDHFALKRKAILTHATMWINLEDLMIDKIS